MNADFLSGGGHATAEPETVPSTSAPVLLRIEPLRPTGEAGDGWGRAAAYDAYADGLHTYAIWSLRDHDAAVDALYCTFVIADRNITQLRQPEQIQPWLYALLRRECMLRSDDSGSATPASDRLRPPSGAADPSGSLASLERNLRRAEFHSLEWPESEGLAPAHREILELTIRHGLDSQGLGLVLGLGQSGRSSGGISGSPAGFGGGVVGSVGSQGFGVLADAWRELERSLAAVAVAKASREHCAQLAELTFGWSGRLNATLRAPLTDHVDGCTRCQHYLHTVIGTPAAPTILPFVAAPRALREILLDELHDPTVAVRAGIDHGAIAARIQRFAPDGFPTVGDSGSVRRRGGRRAAPKTGAPRRGASARGGNASTRAAVDAVQDSARTRTPSESRSATAESAPTSQTSTTSATSATSATSQSSESALPRRMPGANRPRIDARSRSLADAHGRSDADVGVGPNAQLNEDAETSGVYRAPGSWAARVLPADTDTDTDTGTDVEWRPLDDESVPSLRPGSGAGRSRPRRVAAPGSARGGASRPAFISTPSGRFAFRAPNATGTTATTTGPAAAFRAASPSQSPPTSTQPPTPLSTPSETAPLPRFATPAAEAPRGADGRPRARHKSRPVRQAVLSAVALGTVGAAAAASAALLGLVSENHPSQLVDAAPPQDPVSTPGHEGGLTVSVSTPPVPGAPSGAHSSIAVGSGGSGSGSGAGITGTVTTSKSAAPTSGNGANPADFHVSVNQRAADPNSVTILLRNSGSVPIAWKAAARNSWIVLSQNSGTLAAGRSVALTATATSAAPAGQWSSTVAFSPGGAVVTLRGGSTATPPPSSAPPSSAPPASSSPSGSPTPPTPTPSPSPSSSSPAASSAKPSAVSSSESHPTTGGSSSAASSPSGGPGGTPTASQSSGTGSGHRRR